MKRSCYRAKHRRCPRALSPRGVWGSPWLAELLPCSSMLRKHTLSWTHLAAHLCTNTDVCMHAGLSGVWGMCLCWYVRGRLHICAEYSCMCGSSKLYTVYVHVSLLRQMSVGLWLNRCVFFLIQHLFLKLTTLCIKKLSCLFLIFYISFLFLFFPPLPHFDPPLFSFNFS